MRRDPFAAIEHPNDFAKRTEVIRVVNKLPGDQKIALLSYYYGGLSIREVATSMQIPRAAALNHLENAKENVLRELGLNGTTSMMAPGEQIKTPVLKQIFDKYAEESITEDQLRRVLEPVLRMINEGRFNRPRYQRFEWLLKPVASVSVVVALTLMVGFSQPVEAREDIPASKTEVFALFEIEEEENIGEGSAQSADPSPEEEDMEDA
ncbi:MAG: sigma-70 region 4 domain-containing protein [Eggerthellaceae bacterium]|nr:sigma-70 region 4 domain-containing protein [Eggerthellaceae bacterium]